MRIRQILLAAAVAGAALATPATAEPIRECDEFDYQCSLNCGPHLDTSGGIKNVKIVWPAC